MDLQTLIWIVEGMKSEISQLKSEIENLKSSNVKAPKGESNHILDDLMTLKEVLVKLKMCNNTFQKFVRQGIVKPIRMSNRVIRYSRININELLLSLQAS